MLSNYKFNAFTGELYPVPTFTDIGAAPFYVAIRRLPPVASQSAEWTLTAEDAGSLILTNTKWTIRVPSSSTSDFLVGTQILILPIDGSSVKIAALPGVSLIEVPGTNNQVLIKVSSNEWVVA
jgi:hypothetical protein